LHALVRFRAISLLGPHTHTGLHTYNTAIQVAGGTNTRHVASARTSQNSGNYGVVL